MLGSTSVWTHIEMINKIGDTIDRELATHRSKISSLFNRKFPIALGHNESFKWVGRNTSTEMAFSEADPVYSSTMPVAHANRFLLPFNYIGNHNQNHFIINTSLNFRKSLSTQFHRLSSVSEKNERSACILIWTKSRNRNRNTELVNETMISPNSHHSSKDTDYCKLLVVGRMHERPHYH